MSEPDWDKYVCKHCARLYGWLPAAKEFLNDSKKASLKYFTLCDTKAIDIFMLERAGLLVRNANGQLPNVVICEEDIGKISAIFKAVRPPLYEAIIHASLEDVLMPQASNFMQVSPFDPIKNKLERQRLNSKLKSEKLRRLSPFDIVNFDPSNSLLDPGIGQNRLCQALEGLFELQKATPEFLLFVTTPIAPLHKYTERKFKADLKDNVCNHPEVGQQLTKICGTAKYDQLQQLKRLALCIAKSLV